MEVGRTHPEATELLWEGVCLYNAFAALVGALRRHPECLYEVVEELKACVLDHKPLNEDVRNRIETLLKH